MHVVTPLCDVHYRRDGLKLVAWKPVEATEANREASLSMLTKMLDNRELPSTVGRRYGEGIRLVVDINHLPASFVTGGYLTEWLERLRQTHGWGGIQMVYVVLDSAMLQLLFGLFAPDARVDFCLSMEEVMARNQKQRIEDCD